MASSLKLSAVDDQAVRLGRFGRDVCLWHLADMLFMLANVRFWGQSRRRPTAASQSRFMSTRPSRRETSTWIVNPVPDPALPQRQSEHLAKAWSKLSLHMLRPFPVRWISLACSGGEFPVLVSREFTGNPLNFLRKGEAGIAVLGLQGQNFPVFSRKQGKTRRRQVRR